jgi:hypothetical protein
MSAVAATNQMTYDIIDSSKLSHYMTLEEMHERLTANIRKRFAK